jgi:hypothetical protein
VIAFMIEQLMALQIPQAQALIGWNRVGADQPIACCLVHVVCHSPGFNVGRADPQGCTVASRGTASG